MPPTHLLLALFVVAIWGSNFAVIKIGLETWPPMLFGALRFGLSALPLLLLARPAVGWRPLAVYGLLIGVGQFGVLFYAMQRDISPGLASLIIQMQVFFTIGLSALSHREALQPLQALGLGLAITGMALIGWHVSAGGGAITARGMGLVLFAAFCWALANITVKRLGRIDVLPFIAWSSLWPAVVLALLSLAWEGPERIAVAFAQSGAKAWLAAIWQAVGNTLFGFGVWSWLLARHPAVAVTPMALLVPLFGIGAATLAGQEQLETWKALAAALVIAGLGLNVWIGARAARAGAEGS
jgi:O-acetylserine/cysteine efflux transporter